jgi:hypothetical protein
LRNVPFLSRSLQVVEQLSSRWDSSLVDKVVRHAYRVTDEDITAARVSGLSEDQVFEIVVCAAIGQATRQYDTALAALEAVAGKE